mgnify:CR=1 FL=1
MVVAGQMGLAINCMSFCESFRICVTSDDGVLSAQQTKRLCYLMEKSLLDEMKRMEGKPIKNQTEKDKKTDWLLYSFKIVINLEFNISR